MHVREEAARVVNLDVDFRNPSAERPYAVRYDVHGVAAHPKPNQQENATSDVFVRKEELTEARIERESLDAMARRVDHHRAGPINKVSGCDLVNALLEAVFEAAIGRMVSDSAVNREDGFDAGY